MKNILISGITGQDGAYLARLLLNKGCNVIGLTRKYDTDKLSKLAYLNTLDRVNIVECNLLNIKDVINVLSVNKIDEIYNLSSQSSVGVSYKSPVETLKFNTISVLNLLEAIRLVNIKIKLYQASSSEMYGIFDRLPIVEDMPLNPVSPYGVSKASAHWLISCYRESYDIFACSGILFNHESFLRADNFFIKKVIQGAIAIKYKNQQVLKVGNIDVKRDFGFAPDYVEAMYLMMQHDTPGDYIISSGVSISLREIIMHVFKKFDIDEDRLVIDKTLYRPSEIMDIYGSSAKANRVLNWHYDKCFFDILNLIIKEELLFLKKGG